MFLDQRQKRDGLTKIELKTYGLLSYGTAIHVFVCVYFVARAQTYMLQVELTVVGFALLAVVGVFGFAIKHDVRVLDLRRFDKK